MAKFITVTVSTSSTQKTPIEYLINVNHIHRVELLETGNARLYMGETADMKQRIVATIESYDLIKSTILRLTNQLKVNLKGDQK